MLVGNLTAPWVQGCARYRDWITFATDRLGHDRRYAIDASTVERDLGWTPMETLKDGLAKTIDWYLANEWWSEPICSGGYAGGCLATDIWARA